METVIADTGFLDYRNFSLFRPKHCNAFILLP